MKRKDFRELVNAEYCKQPHTCDDQHSNHVWLGLIIEEIGEVAQSINKGEPALNELVQVVALIESWIENRE